MEFITLFGTPRPKDPGVVEKIQRAVSRTKHEFTERLQELVEGKKDIDSQTARGY